MTYKELANRILAMTEKNQNKEVNVLVFNMYKVLPVMDLVVDWAATDEQDSEYYARGVDIVAKLLADGEPYLTVGD